MSFGVTMVRIVVTALRFVHKIKEVIKTPQVSFEIDSWLRVSFLFETYLLYAVTIVKSTIPYQINAKIWIDNTNYCTR